MCRDEGTDMSTVTNPSAFSPPPAAKEDPFRYGWRDIRQKLADGGEVRKRIPLTLYDVHHPQPGDVIVEGSLHDLIRGYLKDVARLRLAGDDTALVLSDCGIYWDDPALEHHSPDVSVIFGVRRQKANW